MQDILFDINIFREYRELKKSNITNEYFWKVWMNIRQLNKYKYIFNTTYSKSARIYYDLYEFNNKFIWGYSIDDLYNLQNLIINPSRLTRSIYIPSNINGFVNLEKLSLFGHRNVDFSKKINNLSKLTSLNIYYNKLTNCPSISNFKNLIQLDLSYNRLIQISDEICFQLKLEVLYLSHNILRCISPSICNLVSLKKLKLNNNCIKKISPDIGKLVNLNKLDLHNNGLSSIPQEISQLISLKKLILHNNNIKDYSNVSNLQNCIINK